MIEITRHWGYEIATAPASHGYIAWARRGRIEADNPMREPFHADVWFDYGPTREEAHRKVLCEIMDVRLRTWGKNLVIAGLIGLSATLLIQWMAT